MTTFLHWVAATEFYVLSNISFITDSLKTIKKNYKIRESLIAKIME